MALERVEARRLVEEKSLASALSQLKVSRHEQQDAEQEARRCQARAEAEGERVARLQREAEEEQRELGSMRRNVLRCTIHAIQT